MELSNIELRKAYLLMFKDYPDVVGIPEICSMLGIGRNKAYILVKSGAIKPIPCSKKIKVPKIEVTNYLIRNI